MKNQDVVGWPQKIGMHPAPHEERVVRVLASSAYDDATRARGGQSWEFHGLVATQPSLASRRRIRF